MEGYKFNRMKQELAKTMELFSVTDLACDAVGTNIESYVSALAEKKNYTPHPVLLSLRDLGVTFTTMARATNRTNAFFSAMISGKKRLPPAMLPAMLELLSYSLSAARLTIGVAADDPKYPAEALELYWSRIASGEKVLEKYRT